MRRLLPTALATAVLVAAFAGVASARLAGAEETASRAPEAAPLRVPAAMPREDAAHPGAWGYRTSGAIGAALEAGSADPAAGASSAPAGASATITVTATVLPVVFVIFDEHGDVARLVTNTEHRDARAVLFLPRTGSEGGEPLRLDAAGWAKARAALARAHAGTGTIWHA